MRRLLLCLLLLASPALAQSQATVDLTWQDTVNTTHTGYAVQRRVRQPGGTFSEWATLATTPASARAYTDATPIAAVDNCYQVLTQSAAGPSAPSSEACVLVPQPVVPPTGVSVTVTVTVGTPAR